MNNLTKKPKLSDYIGAAILGAILGAMFAFGALGGF
jgi:flagellar motor component MotA